MPAKLATCPNCHHVVVPVDCFFNDLGMVFFFWDALFCPDCYYPLPWSSN